MAKKEGSIFSLQTQKTQLEVLEKYYVDSRADIQDIKFHMNVLNGETGELRDLVKEIVKNQQVSQLENSNCINNIKVNQEAMKTNLEWLMKYFWIVASSSVGAVIVGVFNLLNGR